MKNDQTGGAGPDLHATQARVVGRAELKSLLSTRKLIVEPILDADAQLGGLGVDLRLDCFFREFVRTQQPFISPADDATETELREIEPFHDVFYLQPGEFALAQSFEYIALPSGVIGLLNGRSSLGRRGLVVHATANIVDPGFKGHLVFELANLGTMPIELMPLLRIARLVFFETPDGADYAGTFTGQYRITSPKHDRLARRLRDIRNATRLTRAQQTSP